MKKSKFLLIPKSNNFRDFITLQDIGNEIRKNDHNCINFIGPVSDENLSYLLKQNKFDFVFRVDKGKPEKIDKNVRFISWLTDISNSKELEKFNENDIIYTLKKSKIKSKKIKIKHLIPAANIFSNIKTVSDCRLLFGNSKFQEVDISIVSNFCKYELYNGNKKIISDSLKKDMNINKLFHQLIKSLKKKYKVNVFGTMDYSKVFNDNFISYKGEVHNLNYFFEIFRNTKFNLVFDEDKLDFNSNFFNILLVGGTLVLNKKIKNWTKKYFQSDEEITDFCISYDDTETFQSKISEFYDDFKKRLVLGKKASILVNNSHTYKNRVKQILKDLIR